MSSPCTRTTAALIAALATFPLAHCVDAEGPPLAVEQRAFTPASDDGQGGALPPEEQLLPDPPPPVEEPPIAYTIDDLRAFGESDAFADAVAAAQGVDRSDLVVVQPTPGPHRDRCLHDGTEPREPIGDTWDEADEELRDRSSVPLRVRLAAMPKQDPASHEFAVRGPAEATPIVPWPIR